MTNPFEALHISDDEDDSQVTVVKGEEKVKRTHQEKKNYKKQQEVLQQQKEKNIAPIATSQPQGRPHENKPYKHMQRKKKEYLQKDIPAGHTHDRRSGTGRVDRPRKEGGGYGNVGNVKDELNQDKYLQEVKEGEEVKEGDQTPTEPVEVKPEQPQKLTLQEYYKSKGVEIAYQIQQKASTKKQEINAEWIKKEKLTLVETKEDKRIREVKEKEAKEAEARNKNKKNTTEQVDNSLFGFGQKPAAKKEEQEKKGKQAQKGKGKGNNKFTADDFPTL